MEGKISILEKIANKEEPAKPCPRQNTAVASTHFETTVPIKFVSAGLAACVADLMTFPIDTAKVRLQIQGESNKGGSNVAAFKYRGMLRTVYTVGTEEGGKALYSGIVAGLQRQICFASVRIGLYDPVKQFYIDTFKKHGLIGADGKQIPLRICAGVTTGASCVLLAQPTDVVKIRMQANPGKRYTGSIQAYKIIAREEGIKGLWKGLLPNVARNAIVNAGELVSYDLIKEAILNRQLLTDNLPCHFVSAFGAGFCTTIVASPVDVIKTRFMNSPKGVYRGALHCAIKIWKEGGFFAFYKGFTPSFMRLASWNIAMFVTFEQFKRIIHHLSSS